LSKKERINPFSTRSQSIGVNGFNASVGLEGVKLKQKA
jgi:hypothetical protein